MKKSKARVPGKLILSGEHAVVYGSPAIAVAIGRHTTAEISERSSDDILFNLHDLGFRQVVSHENLQGLSRRLKEQYRHFLDRSIAFHELEFPAEALAQFALTHAMEKLNIPMTGLQLDLSSTIPTSCGMGSSAAASLSIIAAVLKYFEIDADDEILFSLCHEVECLQHGFPSGLDMHVIRHGGGVYFQQGKLKSFDLFDDLPLHIVNTGKPSVKTGDSVDAVRKSFGKSEIWDEFTPVTEEMMRGFADKNITNIQSAVKENERLLERIGVVPAFVQNFIRSLEDVSCSAKICGAGAVSGDKAGMLLIIGESESVIKAVCDKYQYKLEPIKLSQEGLVYV